MVNYDYLPEWSVFGPGKSVYFCRADTQKKAIKKAMENGVKPERSTDARPRTGDRELMTRAEFEEFMP